ncbi:hypothetical protein BD413DRAFT_486148, partial [Trametes elegans]
PAPSSRRPRRHPGPLPRLRPAATIMSDVLSLSLLQLLSVFSFLTSVLAVVCVGSGSLNKLSHRFDARVDSAPASDMVASGKQQLWNWSGLPVSFSINSLIGDDEQQEQTGYVGGSELTRMDWQVSRPRTIVTQTFDPPAPMSMAKLIMSRHVSTLFWSRDGLPVVRPIYGLLMPKPCRRVVRRSSRSSCQT